MRTSVTRVAVAVAAAAALSALGTTEATAAGPHARAPQQPRAASAGAPAAAATPGATLWVKRYNHIGADAASSVAASGDKVFVTGYSPGAATGDDYATVAYNAASGAQLWAKRYDGPAHYADIATSVAVSPSGDKVFVTGYSPGAATGDDYATVAYNAASGAQLWTKRYDGPGSGNDAAHSVAASGDTVFVTGYSTGISDGAWTRDYTTIAYNAGTGAQLWLKRYDGPAHSHDVAISMAVSPGGDKVFVTGYSEGGTAELNDYATVAYWAATGAQLWAKRYNGPASGVDDATSVAVSRDGARVFVTGYSMGVAGGYWSYDYATIAYGASNGAQLWAMRYNGPGNLTDVATAVATSRTGTVFVTGYSTGSWSAADYATIAYNPVTGARLWLKRYANSSPPPGNNPDFAESIAVSPGGGTVYVTGQSSGTAGSDYATIAYNAGTGAQLWLKRYNGPGSGDDAAHSLVASPGGGKVFVTGESPGTTTGLDYATIAYSG